MWTSSSPGSYSSLVEQALGLGELVVVEQAGRVQPPRVHGGRLAVVGEQLGVVGGQELGHLGRELAADASGPERHVVSAARSSAASSSVSSEAMRMKPSAASCGNVSPVP